MGLIGVSKTNGIICNANIEHMHIKGEDLIVLL